MFIADLRASDAEFELVAPNKAYEAQPGLTMTDVIWRPISGQRAGDLGHLAKPDRIAGPTRKGRGQRHRA